MTSRPTLAIAGDRRLCGLLAFLPRTPVYRCVGPAWARLAAAHRQRRILELIAVLWLLGIVDLLLTLWAQRFTTFHEMNPIARMLLEGGAIRSVVMFKLGMLSAGSASFWAARHRRCAEGALWALAIAYVLLMFRWSEYTANADELAQVRQMSDFATRPTIIHRGAVTHPAMAGRLAIEAKAL